MALRVLVSPKQGGATEFTRMLEVYWRERGLSDFGFKIDTAIEEVLLHFLIQKIGRRGLSSLLSGFQGHGIASKNTVSPTKGANGP